MQHGYADDIGDFRKISFHAFTAGAYVSRRPQQQTPHTCENVPLLLFRVAGGRS